MSDATPDQGSAELSDERVMQLARENTVLNGSHEFCNYIAFARAILAAATQGAPRVDLAEQWREAFAAFQGAFDTPQMRRLMGDEYSEDARKRLRDFDEAFSAAELVAAQGAPTPAQAGKLPVELMGAYESEASEATFQGFAKSRAADKINSFSRVIYRMGFQSGWEIREKLAAGDAGKTGEAQR